MLGKMAEVHGNRTNAENAGNIAIPDQSGAESGSVGAPNAPLDPNLELVIDRWPALSEAVKADIVALVQRASE